MKRSSGKLPDEAWLAEMKQIREANGLTVKQIADAVYMTPTHLCNMFNGKQAMTPEQQADITQAVGTLQPLREYMDPDHGRNLLSHIKYKQYTQKAVGELVGVSGPFLGQILHSNVKVDPELRQRIIDTIENL